MTYDTGLRYDIHPKTETAGGERMAGQALNHVYGCIDSESPDVTGIRKEEEHLSLHWSIPAKGLNCGAAAEK